LLQVKNVENSNGPCHQKENHNPFLHIHYHRLTGITAQAAYITLIVTMELFLIGPFKTFISQSVLWTEKMSISLRLRDEGFEGKKFFALLNRKYLG
jgi:hypothetical protein